MEDIRIKRLDVIEDEMIKRDLSELDLDNIYGLYDSMLYKTLITGDYDDVFLSDHLDGLSDERKEELFSLARKYNSLCFYDGSFDNWLDSVEGVTSSSYGFIAEKLLDSFDYLIRLAKNGGEDVLKFLNKFSTSEQFGNGAIINILRPGLPNDMIDAEEFDTILETILIEMSKKDGLYKDFSDTQKIILCNNLDGVVYRKTDGKYEITPIDELKKAIVSRYTDEEKYLIKSIDSRSFTQIVEDLYSGYQGKIIKAQR